MENVKFLNADQAALRYGISKWTLYTWALQRRIKSYKVGKLRRFSIEDLDAFFNQNKICLICE